MKITDEMVEAAHNAHWKFPRKRDGNPLPAMRAALEAALGANNGSAAEIINDLMALSHPTAESMPDGMRLTALIQIANRAAGCIEDLARALAEFKNMSTCRDWYEVRRKGEHAFATLERWGLK